MLALVLGSGLAAARWSHAAPVAAASTAPGPGPEAELDTAPAADSPQPEAFEAELARQARELVQRDGSPRMPGVERVEVEIGRLDPRLRLAPCESVRAYLPRGARLLGRSHVGLRCERGAVRWNVFLPVTVRAYARVLVSTAALPAGATLDPGLLTLAEVDLGSGRGAVFRDPAALAGRQLLRPLAAGQALRAPQLKPRQWFAAGDSVRIVASGGGFLVRSSGEALSPGIEGRSARVRTEGGRIVTGVPVAELTLELAL